MSNKLTDSSKGNRLREYHEVLLDMSLSAISALIAKTSIAPIERIKLLHQTQASNISVRTNKSKEMKGVWQTASSIYNNEGLLSFWRGNSATLLKYIPLQTLNFTFHSKLKRIFPKYDQNTNPWKMLLANLVKGALAGVMSISIVYPLDTIRTKMAADLGKDSSTREFIGLLDATKKIYSRGGITSFYTGYMLSLLGTAIYRGFYFGIYETAMKQKVHDESNWRLMYSFAFAQLSTNFSGMIVYPIDTIRRNLVVQAAKSDSDRKVVNDRGFVECARRIYSERGVRGLYAGCLINIIRGSGSSLVMVLYDNLKKATNVGHH